MSRKSIGSFSNDFRKSISVISDHNDCRISAMSDNLAQEEKQRNLMTVEKYNTLKLQSPEITRKTLQFLENRINPPKSVNLILEAFFSLLCDVYKKIDQGFWDTKLKKYFIYKCYMRDIDALTKITKSLKSHLETKGLPFRNIKKCRKALSNYKNADQVNETDGYRRALKQVADYLDYFIAYYDVLVELELEPITKTLNNSFGENPISDCRADYKRSAVDGSPVKSEKVAGVVPRKNKKPTIRKV